MALGATTASPKASPSLKSWVMQHPLLAYFGLAYMITPLIAVVYFYPNFSYELLLLASPWLITLPGALFLLTVFFQSLRKTELVMMWQ
jgi:hypothetical protein